jgi:hypothetical protein
MAPLERKFSRGRLFSGVVPKRRGPAAGPCRPYPTGFSRSMKKDTGLGRESLYKALALGVKLTAHTA